MARRTPGTGRDVSAGIARRLREILEEGVPLTRLELAERALCSARSVHNYLADAERTLGLRVQRERADDKTVRFVADHGSAAGTIEQLAQGLAHEMLRRVFPVAGTRFERRGTSRPQLVVSVRGTYLYDDRHLRVLRRWLQAAATRPRRALQFTYRDKGVLVAWPVGVVVRDLARVYLAGVPEDAERGRDIRTYALERVLDAPVLFMDGNPPRGIDSARIVDAIDDPFSMFPPTHNGVMVHLRFAPHEVTYVVGRRWHRTQKVETRPDGSLDMRFGPADLDETAAWVRQWGPGVRVLGDKRLRAAVPAPEGRVKARDAYAASPSLAKADSTARPQRARGPAGGNKRT
ncbi:MAG TPA: WYL domain-containing protein [Polyangiaceae bacterium]|jgi:hypothetical protein